MKLRCLLFLLVASAPGAFAQKKEMAELNREIGLLRDDLMKMQEKFDEQLANLKAAVQATLDQVNATNRSVAVLERAMRDRLKESDQASATAMTGLGGKVDAMGEEFRNVKESVTDLTARMGKVQQQLVDLDTAVKVRAEPPAPPPGLENAPATPPAGVSARGLWDSAMGDKSSGNYDLALSEFNDYLKYFGTTDLAPEARYHVGHILYQQGKFEESVKALDEVITKGEGPAKVMLDARLIKGQALVKLSRRDEGAEEFRTIVKEGKGTEAATKATAALRGLGLTPPGAAPPKGRKKQ